MSNLVTLPMESEDDLVLCKIVASYLAKYGIPDVMALPLAIELIAALERYRAGKSLNHLARNLGIGADTVTAYRKQEQ